MEEVAALQKTKIKGKGHMAASLLSSSDWAAPNKTGWICKEGANRKSVKKRFFVLQGAKMIYFKTNELNSKSKPIGFFVLEAGSKVALMPRDPRDSKPVFKWRVLTPSRTWEFTNETEQEMKEWVRMIARIVNPEITFGMPLATVVARCKRRGATLDVPNIVVQLLQFLNDNDAINVEGIFRLSGDTNQVKQLKTRFNTEVDTTIRIPKDTDIHVVAGTAKFFLRDLESPLIPTSSNPMLRAILTLKTPKEKIIGYKKLVESLPKENAATLQYIVRYLSQIASNSSVNKMTPQNLAVVFGPCFIRGDPDASLLEVTDTSLNTVMFLIEQYASVFPKDDHIPIPISSNTVAGAGRSMSPPSHHPSPPSHNPAPPSHNPAPPSHSPAAPTHSPVVPSAHSPNSFKAPNTPTNQGPRAGIVIGGYAPPPASGHLPTSTPIDTSSSSGSSSIVLGSSAPTGSGMTSGSAPSSSGSSVTVPSLAPPTPDFNISKPPSFAPPSTPPTLSPAASNPDLFNNANIEYSSSDEEEMVIEFTIPADDPSVVGSIVTDLDDLADFESEDGSIDIFKMLQKQPSSSSPASNSPGKIKPTGGWARGVVVSEAPLPAASVFMTATPPPPITSTPPIDLSSPQPLGTPPVSVAQPIPQPAPLIGSPSSSSINSSYSNGTSPEHSNHSSLNAALSAQLDDITKWLASLGTDFVPYAPVLQQEGFSQVRQLVDITDDDMKELGIKMAHRKGLRAALDKLKTPPQ